MSEEIAADRLRFTKTALVVRKERTEKGIRAVLCLMAAATIVPLLAIVSYLVAEAAPSEPRNLHARRA